MNTTKKSKLYKSYSKNQTKYLIENGAKSVYTGLNKQSNTEYNLFFKTPEVEKLLAKWTKNRPNKT